MQKLLATFAAVFLFCTVAHAVGPTIGPLCIDGVTSTPHPELASPQDDGVWIPTDYKLDPAQASSARLTVFDRAIPLTDKLETCREVTKRMIEAGAQPIVSGKLRDLSLRALLFTGPSGNRLQLNRGSFSATLSNVDSGSRPVAGGSIDFRGSLLWIKPSVDVIATASGIRGEFEIEAWNRKVVGAQVTIGQGITFVTTLEPKAESNVTVRVDLQSGFASIWAANFVGQAPKAASGDLQLPSISMRAANLQVSRIGVVAAGGVLDVAINGIKGNADEVRIPGPDLQWKTKATTIVVDSAEGRAVQDRERLSVAHAALQGLAFQKVETSLQSRAGSDLFRGTAEARFAQLSEKDRSAKSTWMAVTSDALAPILPSGIARMDWNESGPTTGLSVSGRFDANRLKLGGIDLGQPVTLSLLPAALSGDLLIPVKVDIPAATGSISFLNGDQTVAIQGRLEKLSIDGRIIIPLTDIDLSRLEIAPEKFQVVVGAAISISPIVAGVKPNFLDSKLVVLNDTEIRIGKNNKSGTAILTVNTLLVAQPVIKIGDNGTQNPATIDLKSEGMARIRYDIDSSKSVLVQAKLSATNITFNLLGPEPKVLDLGGDKISNPTVSLKRISIEIDQLSAVKVERAELEKLSINASRLTKTLPAGATEGMTYSGALTRPFTLDMVRAGRVSVGDAIVLGGFELNLLDLSIGDASVNLGGGINVAHGTLTLRTQQVREVELLGRRLQQVLGAQLTVEGKVAIHSASMSVNDAVDTRISLNLDGTEGSLNGAGSLKFGTFTGSARSQLVIKFDCRNTGQLNVEMETNLLVGGGDFQARMENGKLSADGATGPIAAAAHSLDPNTGCDNPSIKHVVQKQGEWWTDGICSKGLEFYHCRWESPEVSYSYHVHLAVRLLSATLLMTNPHVYLNSGGEVSVCNIGALVVTPLAILGGYSPGIDSPYPGLDNIVNGLIQIGFEPFQSAALTGIGAGAGWLVSSIATPAGNILCIGKPL